MLRSVKQKWSAFWYPSNLKTNAVVALSSTLLILAFPRTDWWFLSWFALVPLLLVLDGKSPKVAFQKGYLAGFIFFGGTLYWFVNATLLGVLLIWFGTFLLISFLSLYFGLFGLGYVYFQKRNSMANLWIIPSLWVSLEFLRAHLFSGFGWVLLGHSQYQVLPVIQIADLTGVYGVSFLIVLVNYVFKDIILWSRQQATFPAKRIFYLAGTIVVVMAYGFFQLQRTETYPNIVKVAIIQANIEQDLKWKEEAWSAIMEVYKNMTHQASKHNPDLIVWPESSFPGILWEDENFFDEIRQSSRQLQMSILLGAVIKDGAEYHNSAVLLSEKGELAKQYNKIRLVPFGEYVPFRSVIPIVSQVIGNADFSSGKDWTVFTLSQAPKAKFSVLICFEDTVPELSRKFVANGAEFLINITNDAWFGDTKEPYLHLQSSVFRSIENRRNLVRAANTGVSAFIGANGDIYHRVEDTQNKPTYVQGIATDSVSLRTIQTFYTKFGDFFTYLCFGCILVAVLRRKNK